MGYSAQLHRTLFSLLLLQFECVLLLIFICLEIPGMVLEAIAIELFGATGSGCVIFAQWERPNNVNDSYISHYIIDDGISNTSYITSEQSRVIYLSMCAAQSLFIRAFDRCNRDGATAMVPIQFRSVLRTTTIATDVTDAASVNPTSANPTSTGSLQSAGMSNGAII